MVSPPQASTLYSPPNNGQAGPAWQPAHTGASAANILHILIGLAGLCCQQLRFHYLCGLKHPHLISLDIDDFLPAGCCYILYMVSSTSLHP